MSTPDFPRQAQTPGQPSAPSPAPAGTSAHSPTTSDVPAHGTTASDQPTHFAATPGTSAHSPTPPSQPAIPASTFTAHSFSPQQPHSSSQSASAGTPKRLFRLALRTQFTLWRRTWATSTGQKIGFALFAVYAVIGSAGALTMAAITSTEQHSLSALGNAVPLAGDSNMPQPLLDHPWTSIATYGLLGYLFLQMLMPSNEANVTPEKLAPYPLRRRQLAALTAPAILLQTRPLLALLITLATAILVAIIGAQTGGTVVALCAVIGAVLSLVMILLLEQLITQSGAGARSKLRERISSAVSMVLMLGLIAGTMFMNVMDEGNTPGTFPSWFGTVISVMGWTCLTWTAAFEYAAAGLWALTAAHAALGVAYLAILIWIWGAGLERRTLASNQRSDNSSSLSARDSFYLPGLPHTAAGALASRQLRYWRRDRRWAGSFIFIGVCLVFVSCMMFASGSSATPFWGIYLGVLTTFTCMSNPFGSDGPANWVAMSIGVRPRDLIRGYALAAGMVTVCAIVLLAVPGAILSAFIELSSFDPLALTTIGASIISPLLGLPLAFIAAVRAPFQSPPPGSSMWNMNSTGGNRQLVPLLLGMIAAVIIIAPQYYLVYKGLIPPWSVAVVTVVISLIATVFSLRYATRRLETHWPEIFAKVRNWA